MSRKFSGNLRVWLALLVMCLMVFGTCSFAAKAVENPMPVLRIPNTVTSIEDSAFIGNTGLMFVTLPEELVTVGSRAFADCSKLKRVEFLGDGSAVIEDDAFSGCDLDILTIYCAENSAVHTYAQDHHIMCETWDDEIVLTATIKEGDEGIVTLMWRHSSPAQEYAVYEIDEGNQLPTLLGTTSERTFSVSNLRADYHSFQVYSLSDINKKSNIVSHEVPPYMVVETDSLTVDANGNGWGTEGSTLRVRSNASWSATAQADWLEEDLTSYHELTYDSPIALLEGTENRTLTERTGTIRFVCGDNPDITYDVPFTQKAGYHHVITLDNDMRCVTSEASDLVYTVYSNAQWDVRSICDAGTENPATWLTTDIQGGNVENDPECLETLTFSITKNTTGEARSADILLYSTNSEGGWIMRVTQFAGSDYVSPSMFIHEESRNGDNEKLIYVDSSDEWSAVSNNDWIQIWSDSGANGDMLLFTVDKNFDPNNYAAQTYGREGTITLSCGEAASTLTVKQMGGMARPVITSPLLPDDKPIKITDDSLTISWDEVEGAAGYEIGINRKDSDTNEMWRLLGSDETSAVINCADLISGQIYTAIVVALPPEGDTFSRQGTDCIFDFIYVRPILDTYPSKITLSGWTEYYEASVQANGVWEASCDADWLNLHKTKGYYNDNLPFSLDFYEGSGVRTATIILTMYDATETISVTQIPSDNSLDLKVYWPLYQLFASEGESAQIEYRVNAPGWTLELDDSCDWLSSSLVNNELPETDENEESSFFILTAAPNPGGQYRDAAVRFAYNGKIDTEAQFTARQYGVSGNCIELTSGDIGFGPYGGSESTCVISSGDWTATINEDVRDWVTIHDMDGNYAVEGVLTGAPLSEFVIEVTPNLDSNNDTDGRVGAITVSCGPDTAELSIWQDGALAGINFILPEPIQEGYLTLLTFENGSELFRWNYPPKTRMFYVELDGRMDDVYEYFETTKPVFELSSNMLTPDRYYSLRVMADDWNGRSTHAAYDFVYSAEHILSVDTNDIWFGWDERYEYRCEVVSSAPFTIENSGASWLALSIEDDDGRRRPYDGAELAAGSYDVIVMPLSDNDSCVKRLAYITVNSVKGLSHKIEVMMEKQYDEPEQFERTSENIKREGGVFDLPLFVYSSDVTFTVETKYAIGDAGDWLHAPDFLDNTTVNTGLTVTIDENNTGAARAATLELTYRGLTRYFVIRQSGGEDYVRLDWHVIGEIDPMGDHFDVRIESSGAWSVDPDTVPDWVTIINGTGTNGDSLIFEVKPNVDPDDETMPTRLRTCDLTVVCGDMSDTDKLFQIGFAGVYIDNAFSLPAQIPGQLNVLQFSDSTETFGWNKNGELAGYDFRIRRITQDKWDEAWVNIESRECYENDGMICFDLAKDKIWWNWEEEPDCVYELQMRGRTNGVHPETVGYTNWTNPFLFTYQNEKLLLSSYEAWKFDPDKVHQNGDGFGTIHVYASKPWQVSSDTDWLLFRDSDDQSAPLVTTLSTAKNNLMLLLHVNENTGGAARMAALTFTMGSETQTVKITQLGTNKIAILTGSKSQGSEEYDAAEALVQAFGGSVLHETYPDNFINNEPEIIQKLVDFSMDPSVKTIIAVQAVNGTAEAFNRIKASRPEILLIAGVPGEAQDSIAAAADIVLAVDEAETGAQVANLADGWGCGTVVFYSFPRHMDNQTLAAKRDRMREAVEAAGMVFKYRECPDPAHDYTEAVNFIAEDVPAVMNEDPYRKICFYCTNCGLQAPLQSAVLAQDNAYYGLPCCPSPFHGFQEAFDISGSYDDIPGTIATLANYLNEHNAVGRFSTWASPANMAMINGAFYYGMDWNNGRFEGEKLNVEALAEKIWEAAGSSGTLSPHQGYANYLNMMFYPIDFSNYVTASVDNVFSVPAQIPGQLNVLRFSDNTETFGWNKSGEVAGYDFRIRRITQEKCDEAWVNIENRECYENDGMICFDLAKDKVWWDWEEEPDCVYELQMRGRINSVHPKTTGYTNWTDPFLFTYQNEKLLLSSYEAWEFDPDKVHQNGDGFGTIHVYASKPWQVSSDTDWLLFRDSDDQSAPLVTTISSAKNNFMLLLHVNENTGEAARTAALTFTMGSETKTVKITQLGTNKIAILTGSTNQGSEEYDAAEALVRAFGGMVLHETYPDDFINNRSETIQKLVDFSTDPSVKTIIAVQAVNGTAEAFNQIKASRPEILLIAGVPGEAPDSIAAAADIVLTVDEAETGVQVASLANGWGCDTVVFYSFPRHMDYQTLAAKRDRMREAAEAADMVFEYRVCPDPADDFTAAVNFIAEDVPTVMNSDPGRKVCFYCTNCGLQAPLQSAVLTQDNAYYGLPCCPSPFHGFQDAFDISGSYDDIPGTIATLANYLNEHNAVGRFSTWASPANMAMINGAFYYGMDWNNGRFEGEKLDVEALAEKIWEAAGSSGTLSPHQSYANYLNMVFDPIDFSNYVTVD